MFGKDFLLTLLCLSVGSAIVRYVGKPSTYKIGLTEMCVRYAKYLNKDITIDSNSDDLGYCHNCDFEYNHEHEVADPSGDFTSLCPNCGEEGVRTFYRCPNGHAYDPNYPENGESGFSSDHGCPHD